MKHPTEAIAAMDFLVVLIVSLMKDTGRSGRASSEYNCLLFINYDLSDKILFYVSPHSIHAELRTVGVLSLLRSSFKARVGAIYGGV